MANARSFTMDFCKCQSLDELARSPANLPRFVPARKSPDTAKSSPATSLARGCEVALRWSIREQVLVPILAIQTVTIAAITIASVALAARRTEHQIVDRLNGVVDVLDRSNFPLTGGDPGQMKGLSGAEFVAYDAAGLPIAASTPGLIAGGPPLDAIPRRSPERFQS